MNEPDSPTPVVLDVTDSAAVSNVQLDVAETVLYALQQPKHVEIAQLVVLPVS